MVDQIPAFDEAEVLEQVMGRQHPEAREQEVHREKYVSNVFEMP